MKVGKNKIVASKASNNDTPPFRIIALAATVLAFLLALLLLVALFMAKPNMTANFAGLDAKWLGLGCVILAFIAAALWYKNASIQAAKARNEMDKQGMREKQNQDAILRLMDELTEFSNGDLRVQAQVTEEFTGAIADSVNYAIESMRELVGTINRTSARVADASISTRNIAEQMQQSSLEQADKIHSITQIVANMVKSLDHVASSSTDSAEIARNSVTIAQEGARRVNDTIGGMNIIRENIQETSKRIKRLGESSQEIGNIVEIIKGIADQTNILALNAAIQATSAGEAGRGFAVVADEVQRLAERSSNATKRIESLVKTIQTDTNEAVASMEKSTKEVVSGANLAEEAGTSLNRIQEVSTSLAAMIERVSDSTRKVSGMAEGISEDMMQINQMAIKTSENVNKTSESIANLSRLSADLEESVSGFKLPEGY